MRFHMYKKTIPVNDRFWALVIIAALAILVFSINYTGQKRKADDIKDVDKLIDSFQTAYSNKQANELRNLFHSGGVVAYDGDQGKSQRVFGVEDWIQGTDKNVFQIHKEISDRLTDRQIVVLRNIAYAVCNYTYTDETKTGKGTDVLTFIKIHDTWKILSLQWTGDES